ncbi:hypothetical protein [Paraburkholderia sp. SOS3]|uniref:hypothetical protein n=1 Tax=Paraburkholderia sp. SOS3 TaxID=1926494 RepID=UPI0012EB6A2B|nr:hypothetical protein [Paraburkholderia sp. SOS3]
MNQFDLWPVASTGERIDKPRHLPERGGTHQLVDGLPARPRARWVKEAGQLKMVWTADQVSHPDR